MKHLERTLCSLVFVSLCQVLVLVSSCIQSTLLVTLLTRLCDTWVRCYSVCAEGALLMILSDADSHCLTVSSVSSLFCMSFYCLRHACV